MYVYKMRPSRIQDSLRLCIRLLARPLLSEQLRDQEVLLPEPHILLPTLPLLCAEIPFRLRVLALGLFLPRNDLGLLRVRRVPVGGELCTPAGVNAFAERLEVGCPGPPEIGGSGGEVQDALSTRSS